MKGRTNAGAYAAVLVCIVWALSDYGVAAEGTALTVQQTDPYQQAGGAGTAQGASSQQDKALSTDQQLAASLAEVLAIALQPSNATAGTLRSLPQQSIVLDPGDLQSAGGTAAASTEEQKLIPEPPPAAQAASEAASGSEGQQQQQQQQPEQALDKTEETRAQLQPEQAAASAGESVGTGAVQPADVLPSGEGGQQQQQQQPEQAASVGGTVGTGGLLPAQALDAYPGALDGAGAALAAAAGAQNSSAVAEGEAAVIAQHALTQSELIIQTDAEGMVTAAAAISQTSVGIVTTGAEYVAFERGNDTAKLGLVRLLPAQMILPYPAQKNLTEADFRNVSSLLRDRSGANVTTANRTGIFRRATGKEEGKGGKAGKGQPGGSGCGKNRNAPCKFFVLDVSEVAVELGFPSCSVDQFVADPESGMTLPNPAIVPNFSQPIPPKGHEWIYPYSTQPHYLSQNAGPWYVYHTLRNSVNSVRTIAEADVVYVYDYCYVMWALGDHHARDHWWLRDNYNPDRKAGHYLLSSYRAIMGLPRWRRTGGRDFVFYHSHPGFEWDDLAMTTAYQDMLCVDFQWATVLVVEQGQRWRCPSYSPRSTIVVPYSSTESVNTIPLRPDGEKESLLFFRGKCDPAIPSNMGKLMRSHVVRHLREGIAAGQPPQGQRAAPEINVCCHGQAAGDEVRCTEREFEQNVFVTQRHKLVLEQMANSAFCLILPGNSQSSQRLTEAFLAGCIPVFIGPPWHSLPFTQKVDYASAALFLNISSPASEALPWWSHPELKVHKGLDPRTQLEDRFSPSWWFADVPSTAIIPLRKIDAVLPYLRQMPHEWMENKRRAVMKYRSLFIYTTSAQTHEPSASDTIVDLMCSYAKLGTFQDSSSL
ncbi:g9051 [Coccomyxa elongata]